MLNNYNYFIVLAEELNISNAANKLYISHQNLSKYLKNLETEYGVALFKRKPTFALTHAGEVLFDTFKQVDLMEQNLITQMANIRNAKEGVIHLGILEGRYPIIIPKLYKQFHKAYPHVKLVVYNKSSPEMQQMVLNNTLDLYLSCQCSLLKNLAFKKIISEKIYLIISDNMLKEYFTDYPACKERFAKGVNLHEFTNVPVVLNKTSFVVRNMIDNYLTKTGITLNCITELTQPDIQYKLSAEDYAASFCFSMYLPGIQELNFINKATVEQDNLNIFPINGLDTPNSFGIVYLKNKIFPLYVQELCKIIKKTCASTIADIKI